MTEQNDFFVGKKVGSIPYGPYDMEHMKFVETYSKLNFKLARNQTIKVRLG